METEDEKILRKKKESADRAEAELDDMMNSARRAVEKAEVALKKTEEEEARQRPPL